MHTLKLHSKQALRTEVNNFEANSKTQSMMEPVGTGCFKLMKLPVSSHYVASVQKKVMLGLSMPQRRGLREDTKKTSNP